MCTRRFPFSRVIAVEPDPSNFAAVFGNVARYENVTPVRAALWNNVGEITLGSSDAHPKGPCQVGENGDTRVTAMTMDTLTRDDVWPRYDPATHSFGGRFLRWALVAEIKAPVLPKFLDLQTSHKPASKPLWSLVRLRD